MNVRGSDRINPILVFSHGGPPAPQMPAAWSFQRPWEDFFTVAQWDQRGSGKSFPLNNPKVIRRTPTVDRCRDDAIGLIKGLWRKYGQRKVIFVSHGGGSVVGLAVAAKRPDLLYAYVGIGQVSDFREEERVGFEWTLDQALKAGDPHAVQDLERIEPSPVQGRSTSPR